MSFLTRLTQWVLIELPCVGTDPALLERVQGICTQHKGSTRLYLELTTSAGIHVTVQSRRPAGVKPCNALAAEITELLGEGHVAMVGRRRRPRPRRSTPPATDRYGSGTEQAPPDGMVEAELLGGPAERDGRDST